VLVGRVLRPHGLRGELLVEPLSDLPERLEPGSVLAVTGPDPDQPATAKPAGAPPPASVTVAAARPHRGAVLVRFDGVGDRDAAACLAGAWLAVERAAVPPPPPGTWYHFQLVGCRCRDRGAGDLGEVVEVVEDGGGVLLLVEDGRRRVPVPFVAEFLRRVDPDAGVIEVELPPGLIETCASTS
jgi:16S rRNA processing protein RimM